MQCRYTPHRTIQTNGRSYRCGRTTFGKPTPSRPLQRAGAFERDRPAIMEIFAEIRPAEVIVPAQPVLVFQLLLLDLHQETPIREIHVAPIDHQDATIGVHAVRRLNRGLV